MPAENRILIVEDSEVIAKDYRDELRAAFPAIEIDIARGLDRAEALLKQHSYIAILSDHKYPILEADADEPNMDVGIGLRTIDSIRAEKYGPDNSKAVIAWHSTMPWKGVEQKGKADHYADKNAFDSKTLPFLKAKMQERGVMPQVDAVIAAKPPEVQPPTL